jgi:hypothetical protein
MYINDISKQIAHRCDKKTLAAAQLHNMPGNLSYNVLDVTLD